MANAGLHIKVTEIVGEAYILALKAATDQTDKIVIVSRQTR